LYNYLKNTSGNIPTDIIVKFAKDIASGMNMVHSTGIVHRDLKSSLFFSFLFFIFSFSFSFSFSFFKKDSPSKNKNKIDQIF